MTDEPRMDARIRSWVEHDALAIGASVLPPHLRTRVVEATGLVPQRGRSRWSFRRSPGPRSEATIGISTSPVAARRTRSLSSPADAVVAAGLIALVVAVVSLNLPPNRGGTGGAGASAVPSPARELLPEDEILGGDEGYLVGEYALAVDGIELTLSLGSSPPWQDWEGLKDGLFVSNSTVGPQDAEAMILWTSFPDSQHARPCLLAPAAGSALDLANSVATAPGTALVSGPSGVIVGGRAAQHVVVTVAPDLDMVLLPGDWEPGCDPAYFFGWQPSHRGAFWTETVPGDTLNIWIVDVDGKLLFIEAATKIDAGLAVIDEIDKIIDSVRIK